MRESAQPTAAGAPPLVLPGAGASPSSTAVDPGWEHAVAQDHTRNKVKCNYCHKVVSGGIYRLKQHLARIPGQVTHCTQAPEDVVRNMKHHLQAVRRRRHMQLEDHASCHSNDNINDNGNGNGNDLEAFRQNRRPACQGDCLTMVPSGPTLRSLGLVDPGWEHGVALGNTKHKVKCNYCHKVVSGGVNRFKQHLARIPGEVAPCLSAPHVVCLDMKENMKWHQNSRKQRMATKQLAELYMAASDNQEVQGANRRSKRRHLPSEGDVSCSRPSKKSSTSKFQPPDPTGAGAHTNGAQMNLGPLFAVAKKQKRSLPAYNKQLKQQGVTDKKKGNKDVNSAICKFFCFAGIPFELADSSYFHNMLDLVAVHGPGLKGSASKLLAARYLQDEVKATAKYQSEIRTTWRGTGCSIIADSWKNLEEKSMINFLVSCPRGAYFISSIDASDAVNYATCLFKLMDEVVDAVGEENVVQVITKNSECFRAAGKMLEEKRRSLFWMPSATDCIDQILVDFMEIEIVKECTVQGQIVTRYIHNSSWLLDLMKNEFTKGKDLIEPSTSKAATTFLTLQSLVQHRAALEKLFQSDKWRMSEMCKSCLCKAVERIVFDTAFWEKMLHVKRSVEPFLQILKKLDSSGNLSMPFLYSDMYQAELLVRTVNGDDVTFYGPFVEVIDRHWATLFNHPLYVAAYFLNPACRYQPDFNASPEVIRGLNKCISRIESDNRKRISATAQISEFVYAKADFGTELALSTRMDLHPAAWWQQHGIGCLELQSIAIRILSQSCTTLGCEHCWSTFDLVDNTRRNHLFHQRQLDYVSAHYNLRLQERQSKKNGDSSVPHNIQMLENVLGDWIAEPGFVDGQQDEAVLSNEDEMNENEDPDKALRPSNENMTTLLKLVEEANHLDSVLGDDDDKDSGNNTWVDDEC